MSVVSKRGRCLDVVMRVLAIGLLELEAQARQAKRGLWADPHPIEPWEWRKRERGDVAMRQLGVVTLVGVDR